MIQFLINNWMLVLLAAVSGGALLWQAMQQGGGAGVPTSEAVRLMNREKAVLIDVREAAEYAAGHAVGARSVPLAGLDGARELPANKALPVLVMCASGSRASRAAAQLRKAGYEKAHVVAGGMSAWREAGLPVDKKAT